MKQNGPFCNTAELPAGLPPTRPEHISNPRHISNPCQCYKRYWGQSPLTRPVCNSAGLAYPEAWLDAVRVGLVLYGVPPCSRLKSRRRPMRLRWLRRMNPACLKRFSKCTS